MTPNLDVEKNKNKYFFF